MKTIKTYFYITEEIELTDEEYDTVWHEVNDDETSWLPPYHTFELIDRKAKHDLDDLEMIEVNGFKVWEA